MQEQKVPSEQVQLIMSAKRELHKMEAGQPKMIAADIRKTGYSKIAQLVDMPPEADLTQAEKFSPQLAHEDDDDDQGNDELNVTKNPQSMTKGTGKQQAIQNNVKSNK